MSKVLLLTDKDVESVLTMKDTIKVMKAAFGELSEGSAILPQRIVIPVKEQKGISFYMPALLPQMGSLAIKVVSVFRNNPSRFGLPTTLGKVLLQDIKTGDVVCIMDGRYLTAMRTGAVSGCAMEYLARTAVTTVALFGTGIQGAAQLWAAYETRPNIEVCKVYDPRYDAAEDFTLKMRKKIQIPEIVVIKSPKETVKGSDIILTATTSLVPIFRGDWLEPGVHISSIGTRYSRTRELDIETIRRAKIVCDQVSACLAEADDLSIPIKKGIITKEHIHASLGEIIRGVKGGRENDSEITLFKSVGLAIQDVAAAKLVYDKALKLDRGMEIEI